MVEKPGILSRNQRVDNVRRNFIEVGMHAVARIAEITAHFLAVGAVNYRRELILRVAQFLNGGHIAYNAIVDQDEKHCHNQHSDGKYKPQHPGNTSGNGFLAALFGLFYILYILIILTIHIREFCFNLQS